MSKEKGKFIACLGLTGLSLAGVVGTTSDYDNLDAAITRQVDNTYPLAAPSNMYSDQASSILARVVTDAYNLTRSGQLTQAGELLQNPDVQEAAQVIESLQLRDTLRERHGVRRTLDGVGSAFGILGTVGFGIFSILFGVKLFNKHRSSTFSEKYTS